MAVFRRPALTVDAVVVHAGPAGPSVLLVERGREPFRGRHALPGGFVDYGEDPDLAIARELAEETGLTGLDLRQYRTFGAPGRDPRGHTVTVVYVAELAGPRPSPRAGDDAAAAGWHPAGSLPKLAFDHADIVARVLRDRAAFRG